MNKIIFNTKHFVLTGMIAMASSSVMAVNALHTFTSGGTIKASEMNDNFTTLNTAVNNLSATPSSSGFTIKDAGTYVGQVGLGELANFSLLTGAGGATGTAAADAACAATYPGSHAEFNMLALWKSTVNGVLPDPAPAYGYWASTVTEVPVSMGMSGLLGRTSDCDNWTNNVSGRIGFIRPSISTEQISVQITLSSCFANNMAVACFTTP